MAENNSRKFTTTLVFSRYPQIVERYTYRLPNINQLINGEGLANPSSI
jgi:hypothetical protein